MNCTRTPVSYPSRTDTERTTDYIDATPRNDVVNERRSDGASEETSNVERVAVGNACASSAFQYTFITFIACPSSVWVSLRKHIPFYPTLRPLSHPRLKGIGCSRCSRCSRCAPSECSPVANPLSPRVRGSLHLFISHPSGFHLSPGFSVSFNFSTRLTTFRASPSHLAANL